MNDATRAARARLESLVPAGNGGQAGGFIVPPGAVDIGSSRAFAEGGQPPKSPPYLVGEQRQEFMVPRNGGLDVDRPA